MADPVPPPSDLPAPYTSPWGLLAAALRAVLASLRLKLRELWRRNRDGELSVPGFWPQGLSPLFWPLLLTVLLCVAIAFGATAWGLISHRDAPLPPGRTAPETAAPAPAAPGVSREQGVAEGTPPPAAAPAAPQGPTTPDPPASGPAAFVPVGPPLAAAPMVAPPMPEPPPALELDPLLALLEDDDPRHLIASAQPLPAESRLVLTMAPSYIELLPASRRRWAERWQERVRSLGYERLELVDGAGRSLARGALVGSGMILLDPFGPT